MNDQDFEYLFKIVILGDSGVGKTNILSRFVQDTFLIDSKPTLGVQFATQTMITKQKKIVKNQIWDTAGQQKFRAITNTYYRRAQGVMIVFDLTKYKTFENLEFWMDEVRLHAEKDVKMVLIGNKSDIPNREINQEEIQNFASINKMAFLQTSALNGQNIKEAFQWLTQQMYKATTQNQPVLSLKIEKKDLKEIPKLVQSTKLQQKEIKSSKKQKKMGNKTKCC